MDRSYALERLPMGEEADRGAEPALSARLALYDRAAEYYRAARTPRESWKRIEDLEAQLAEYELRYEGRDYLGAAGVLRDIDFDYLRLWGYNRQVIELHKRLRGRLDDPDARESSVGVLGTAYREVGQIRKAIESYEEALGLARDLNNRQSEGAWLGNLGLCYSDLGETKRAMKHHEQALVISLEIGNRQSEGNQLGNLGTCYYALEETERAKEYYEQALAIAQEIGDKRMEELLQRNLEIPFRRSDKHGQ
ncbi:MAG: tetratricopeptide repeat protein [Chloroflexia bacterium]